MDKPGRSGSRDVGQSRRNIFVLALCSMFSYQIGTFLGCSSRSFAKSYYYGEQASYLPMPTASGEDDDDADDDDTDAPLFRTTSQSVRVNRKPDDSRLVERALMTRSNLPYKCGVVWFYHIPSTGGASINAWFRKYKKPKLGNITYYQGWETAVKKDGSFHRGPDHVEKKFQAGMQEHISNLGPSEWRIAHSHIVDMYLNESEDILNGWRRDVEAQGCEMINTIMIRDPLSHSMSLHKIIKQKNSNRTEWLEYLSSPTGMGKWATILDFFLYNNQGRRTRPGYPTEGGRNPFNVTKEEKVRRGMELLARHFDLVTVGNHKVFQERLLSMTGWLHSDIPHTNVFKGQLDFTKKEVEHMQKVLKANGDTDFVYEAEKKYSNAPWCRYAGRRNQTDSI